MATCNTCNRDMNDATGCTDDRTITIDGETYDPIPFGEEDNTRTYDDVLANYDREIADGGRGRLTADDVRQERDRFIEQWGDDPAAFNDRDCHDCGASMGAIHHPGCDWETCPACGGQYLSCPCETEEKRRIWSDPAPGYMVETRNE